MDPGNIESITHLSIGGAWIDCSVREVHALSAVATKHPVEEGADITEHVRQQPEQIQIEGIVTNTPIETPESHLNGAVASPSTFEISYEVAAPGITRTLQIEGEPTYGWLQYGSVLAGVYSSIRNAPFVPRRKLSMIVPDDRFRVTDTKGPTGFSFDRDTNRVGLVYEFLRASFLAGSPITVVTGLRHYDNCVIIDLQVQRDSKTGSSLFFGATCEVIRIVTTAAGQPIPQDVRATPGKPKGTQNTVPTKPGEVPPQVPAKAKGLLETLTGKGQ